MPLAVLMLDEAVLIRRGNPWMAVRAVNQFAGSVWIRCPCIGMLQLLMLKASCRTVVRLGHPPEGTLGGCNRG